MRKPRDIDAELRALSDKAKALKSRKVVQLGEVIIATGAGDLEPEVIAGVMLSALETATPELRIEWRRKGEGFFRRTSKAAARSAGDGPAAQEDRRDDSQGASGSGAG